MKVACLGGGPAGLYAATSLKLRDPAIGVTVYERNRADDTFGWGVVLSDETLGNLAANDAESAATIREHFAYWDDVATVVNGAREVSGGHGFCGIGRKRLLLILQDRARDLGVDLRFEAEVASADDLAANHDLVIAADGLNSRTRAAHPDHFRPQTDLRRCKFVWLGTTQTFRDAFTFIFERTDHGWLWAHAYQFEPGTATFIVECSEATWAAWGFGDMSQADSIALCERIFADHLGGHPLMSNANHIRGSAWINFPRVLCDRWSRDNVVLLGDAAATAHFSIGSGTKLALESAIALADAVTQAPTLAEALGRYETERRAQVLRLQSAALNSLNWFENVERYLDFEPIQLGYAMLTRSQRIGHENLRLRDPAWLDRAERWFMTSAGLTGPGATRPPAEVPFAPRAVTLSGRIVARAADDRVETIVAAARSAALVVTATIGLGAPFDGARWTGIVTQVRRIADTRLCARLQSGHTLGTLAGAARAAHRAGFDMIEVDVEGEAQAERLAEAVAAVRAVWPAPIAVRMPVTDHADAVALARDLRDAGADIVVPFAARDGAARGRLHQVPLTDLIRNEACVATMAEGGIATRDQANAILLAGRADLVVLDPAPGAAAGATDGTENGPTDRPTDRPSNGPSNGPTDGPTDGPADEAAA